MINMKKNPLAVAVAVLAVAVIALAYNQFCVAPSGKMPDWIVIEEGPVAHGVEKFYRNAYFKGNIEVAGDLEIHGDSTLGSTTVVSSTELAVTYGLAISPTVSHIRLSNAAAITNATLVSGTTAGQLLYLTGVNVSGTITIAEGSNHFGGDLAFTDQAYDAGTLIWDGTRWILSAWHDN
jgi:hypothetical protein